MNEEEFKKLYELENTYWWHVGKNTLIKNIIEKFVFPKDEHSGKQLLDLGSGTGSIVKLLSSYGTVSGIDSSAKAIDFCRKRGLNNVSECKVEELNFAQDSFDFISAFDLLEHIADDRAVINEVYKLLKPGGYFLINVPAHKFLWSEHDEALCHRRRYSRNELVYKVTSEGFRIRKLSYSVFFFFLPILCFRTFQSLFIKSSYPKTSYILLPDWLNSILIWLLHIEAAIIPHISLPLGVTLICLAQKPIDAE